MLDNAAVESRREFVREVTKLKLWYAWRLQKHDGLDFETAAATRVGIRELTVFGGNRDHVNPEDTAGWCRVLDELGALYGGHSADTTSKAIEDEGLALLWPHLTPCFEHDAAETTRWVAGSFGCFKYEYRSFYAEPDSADHLTLHVRNAYQPDSPFQHVPEMARSLQEIAACAAQERPDVACVQCATWLNSLPPFAKLFPPSWTDTSLPGAPGNHTGWWGQFMNRRGGFHARNAREFRSTARFPYEHRMCRCPISDLQEHLRGLASSA
ncbi:MAG: hypothetical protein HN742_05750 [Lentisphaerae bacterium]|nr:hypothetical protein [Lentisphaerota bacterium]MBT5607408.1 hypothetical protein [Lentisphaerota bacterium]MBT7056116.1 hypothetical protein [Lentisphaerota bacterium]MBT7841354.1 hypothetical protein [Lentisphaerota bacterium]